MSVYKMTLNYPNTGNQEIQIPGLGTYKNGSTYEVSKEEADSFRQFQTDHNMPNRTLLEAFKGDPYVTVETTSEKPKTEQKKEGND